MIRKLTNDELQLVYEVLQHFKDKCNKAVSTYKEAGVDENDKLAGRPLLYYKHARKYLDYMLWYFNPNKPQKGKRVKNGTADD